MIEDILDKFRKKPKVRTAFFILSVLSLVATSFIVINVIPKVKITADQYEAEFSFIPEETTVSAGDVSIARVFLNTCKGSKGECASVVSARFRLCFDPNALEIVDENNNRIDKIVSGDTVTNDAIFKNEIDNKVNYSYNGEECLGAIELSMYSDPEDKSTHFSGSAGVFATIRFKALKSGKHNVDFSFEGRGNTLDDTDAFLSEDGGVDIVTSVSGFTLEVESVQGEASLSLETETSDKDSVAVGETFTINLLVNSGEQQTVATDFIIKFNPSQLKLIDEDQNLGGTQINYGDVYETYQYLNGAGADIESGIIDITGYTLDGTLPLDNSLFGQARFEVLDGVNETISLIIDFEKGKTNESNVLLYEPDIPKDSATDLLSLVNNLELTISPTKGPEAPTNLTSSSHTVSKWSNNNIIQISWSAPNEYSGKGIVGYSYIFNNSNLTEPDEFVDTSNNNTESPALKEGTNHYFHIKAIDGAENWGETGHIGPFYIDTTSPNTPGTPTATLNQTTLIPTWTWSPAIDTGSGISDYTVEWANNNSFSNLKSSTSSTSSFTHSTTLPEGLWYFKVKANDEALNSSSYSTYGSINIEINNAPNAPSSLGPNELISGKVIDNITPKFTFEIKDPDQEDKVGFKIQISREADFINNVVDYISKLNLRGNASFTLGQAPAGGSYIEGLEGQALDNGNYYWRVSAYDENNLYSAYKTANSSGVAFTVNALPPKQTCGRKANITGESCCVDGQDVSILVYHWGTRFKTELPECSRCDLDNNGKINGADIAILVTQWGCE